MRYRNKSTIMGASLISMSLLISACGGGGSSLGSDSVTDNGTENIAGSGGSETDNGDNAGGGDTNTGAEATAEVLTPINVTEASVVAAATKVTGGTVARSAKDFSFPEVVDQNGALSMTIPNGPAPQFSARRTVLQGNGQTVQFGDPVILKYDMFSWSNGELVDSSSQYEEAHSVKAGVIEAFPVPEYLTSSLLGRAIGDTIQVVLPVGTEDLPEYLDSNDAYVLLVEML